MFFRILKNIFINVKNNELYIARQYALKLYDILEREQVGGGFDDNLRSDIDPILNKLQIKYDHIQVVLRVFDAVRKYISEINTDEAEKIAVIMDEMRTILINRLEKDNLQTSS